MDKKGGVELSIESIIVVIIAIVVLTILLVGINNTFGAANKKMEERIATEVEPGEPTSSNPISVSRESIITTAGATEAIKIAVMNPTGSDWIRRNQLYQEGGSGCNAADGVCYLVGGCGVDDVDCKGRTDWGCQTEGICVVSDDCPEPSDGFAQGQDCGPQEGIDLIIRCDNELQINEVSLPKKILSGEIQTFTSLFSIKKGVSGRYLCNLRVFGHDSNGVEITGYAKDLTIEVK